MAGNGGGGGGTKKQVYDRKKINEADDEEYPQTKHYTCENESPIGTIFFLCPCGRG